MLEGKVSTLLHQSRMSCVNITDLIPNPLTPLEILVRKGAYESRLENYAAVGSLGVSRFINFSILDLTN